MAADQISSLFYLWVLQIAWWLAAMLPLSAAGILVALGLQTLHRRARVIEKESVESKPEGFMKLLQDKFTHQAISQSMLFIIFGGLCLGGIVGLFLQGIIQHGVQKAVESGKFLNQGAGATSGNGSSLDLILLLALVIGVVMVVLAVHIYRSLCRSAEELVRSLTSRDATRPLIVRWFHDSKKMGLVVLVFGGWLCFGVIMQVVGFIVMVVPWPAGLPPFSFPWATNALIGILVAVGLILFFVLFALPVWMGVRNFKLDVRYYRENPTFRLIANVSSALGLGAFGALLFINLLHHTGIVPLPAQWFNFVPAFWVLSYLMAYAAAVLVQIFLFRKRHRDFALENIVVAFIIAFPGAVPVFFLLSSLFANFMPWLFGQF
jgi:hypothetical protein